MENKKILRSSFIGIVLWLISAVIVGVCMVTDLINGGEGIINSQIFVYGPRAAIGDYLNMWNPHYFNHETAFIGLALVLVAICLGFVTIILSIIRKRPALLLSALGIVISIGFLPFILILAIPMVQLGELRVSAFFLLAGAFGIDLFAILFALLPAFKLLFGLVEKAAGYGDEEECCCCEGGIDENQVRKIVNKGLEEHVDEYHQEKEEEPAPAPAPVKEEEPEPEPEEEPEEEIEDEEELEDEGDEEAPAEEVQGEGGLVIKGKKRRASFETRLRNSEFDIRHKYYDLRDYIKWYGMRNRISIPGDTFSYKRQRYIFVTIVGKHLRIYLNLDPKDYADSTIPVEPAEAKKYEDLPCLLRIKSDLAYRRAKKLVDDVMAKVGLPRPEGDEPKETQKQD